MISEFIIELNTSKLFFLTNFSRQLRKVRYYIREYGGAGSGSGGEMSSGLVRVASADLL